MAEKLPFPRGGDMGKTRDHAPMPKGGDHANPGAPAGKFTQGPKTQSSVKYGRYPSTTTGGK